jgi:phosphoribosylanthranilate isomerase
VTVVGLFVDEAPERVREVLGQARIDLLQFHGDEPADYCESFARPYIKAVRMKPGVDLARLAENYRSASGLLLDADDPKAKGGTGTRFDWAAVPADCKLPVILAGGLSPANAGEALRQTRPFGLDVSSGVEAAKGVKDADKMAAFLKEVQDFDNLRTN